MDDTKLLEEYVRRHSETAFTALVERYLPLVHAAALRRMQGDEHRAREVTQMVFIELARKAAKLVSHPALAAWLHQSTRWNAANLERAERRRIHHERAAARQQEPVEQPAAASTPEAEWETIAPVLDAALDTLRDRDRDAVLQRFFLDRPYGEIGRMIGVSENAARMRVDRALDVLRLALARHGITSSSAALGGVLLAQQATAASPGGLSPASIAAIMHEATTAAAASAAAGSANTLLATKIGAGLAAGLAIVLGGAYWQTEATARRLEAELAGMHAVQPTPTARPQSTARAAQSEADARAIEEEILAAAEIVVPLSPEQQERVRLDLIVKKGDLDGQYAALFRELRLPPETLDRLKTILVERNQAIYDARQLAKEQGVVFASLAEEQQVVRSVLTDIDASVATLLDAAHLAQFREYEDLAPYREADAALAHRVAPLLKNPKDDERDRTFARLLRETAPDFPNRLYCANEWPVDFPPEFIEAARTRLEPSTAERLEHENKMRAIQRRMGEIARQAALEGKLGTLSKSVERQYQAERARRAAEGTP